MKGAAQRSSSGGAQADTITTTHTSFLFLGYDPPSRRWDHRNPHTIGLRGGPDLIPDKSTDDK